VCVYACGAMIIKSRLMVQPGEACCDKKQTTYGRGSKPVSIMQRLSRSFRAALAGPCSITAPLPALRRVSLPADDLAEADPAPGEWGDLGEAMHAASCLLRSMSTCSNTSATT